MHQIAFDESPKLGAQGLLGDKIDQATHPAGPRERTAGPFARARTEQTEAAHAEAALHLRLVPAQESQGFGSIHARIMPQDFDSCRKVWRAKR